MGNMTLGKRISLGFGIIIVIMLALGAIGVMNMNSAANNSDALANKYAPEVSVSTRAERNVMKMMYAMRGYQFTNSETFLKEGLETLKRSKDRIKDMKDLSEKYPELVKLKEVAGKIENSVLEYENLIDQTKTTMAKMETIRSKMDDSAKRFVENTYAYLDSQNKAFKKESYENPTPQMLNERHEKITLINDIIDHGNGVRLANFRAQSLRDASIIKDAMINFDKMEKAIEKILKITRLEKDIQDVENVRKAKNDYKKAVEEYLVADTELAKIGEGRVKYGSEALKYGEEISRAGVSQTTELAVEANDGLTSASMIMIVGLIISVILGILIAAFITITTTRVITSSVVSIIEASDQVVSASNEIADSSTSLAEGASKQASSVEEVSATIEESTSINTQNAENSREADILARETKSAAEDGYSKGNELMNAMKAINHSSEKISKIIKTIDEIASQTKLLALNAAVEAARAGEHGLGFAVVADEVKSLAQRSADAATETANIIEESINQAKNGSSISEQTSEAFNNILEKINKTSNLIGEISISAKEQSEGMNQIATAMGEIDQITQQNAATSEEAAAASEELNAQALSMKETINVIAKMVGYATTSAHATQPTKKSQKALSKPKPKLISKKVSKKQSNDDVFPLDDDDMKEF